jgi:hypothetical protein
MSSQNFPIRYVDALPTYFWNFTPRRYYQKSHSVSNLQKPQGLYLMEEEITAYNAKKGITLQGGISE